MALVLVLAALALLSFLVVLVLTMTRNEDRAAKSSADIIEVRTLADLPAQIVISQIRRATSNLGTAYTTRIHDLQVQPRGFGDPVQKLFSFNDGERVVAALCLDPTDPDLRSEDSEVAPPLHLMLATSEGRGYRISLQGFCEPSTRSGRRYAKPPSGVEIVKVALTRGTEALLCVSRGGRSLLCPIEEVSFLNGASKGVTLIKLEDGDRLLTIRVCANDSDGCLVQRSDGGKEIWLEAGRLQLVGRAGKGSNVIKRGQLVLIGEEKNGNNDES